MRFVVRFLHALNRYCYRIYLASTVYALALKGSHTRSLLLKFLSVLNRFVMIVVYIYETVDSSDETTEQRPAHNTGNSYPQAFPPWAEMQNCPRHCPRQYSTTLLHQRKIVPFAPIFTTSLRIAPTIYERITTHALLLVLTHTKAFSSNSSTPLEYLITIVGRYRDSTYRRLQDVPTTRRVYMTLTTADRKDFLWWIAITEKLTKERPGTLPLNHRARIVW